MIQLDFRSRIKKSDSDSTQTHPTPCTPQPWFPRCGHPLIPA